MVPRFGDDRSVRSDPGVNVVPGVNVFSVIRLGKESGLNLAARYIRQGTRQAVPLDRMAAKGEPLL
jgi:hypothetical protein